MVRLNRRVNKLVWALVAVFLSECMLFSTAMYVRKRDIELLTPLVESKARIDSLVVKQNKAVHHITRVESLAVRIDSTLTKAREVHNDR